MGSLTKRPQEVQISLNYHGIIKVTVHCKVRLDVDTEVDILGKTTNILGQLSRWSVQQSGEVSISRVDPMIQCITTVHNLRNVVHVICEQIIEHGL